MSDAPRERPHLPILTIVFVASGLALSTFPGGADLLEYRRGEVETGAIWRALTGQMVHWTPRMTLVDLGAVLLLGGWCERRRRSLFVAVTTLSACLLGAGVHVITSVEVYRGASGIASALFVAACLEAWAISPRRVTRWILLALLGALLLKIAIEAATGRALAAGPLPDGVVTVPWIHLIGALSGSIAWRGRVETEGT